MIAQLLPRQGCIVKCHGNLLIRSEDEWDKHELASMLLASSRQRHTVIRCSHHFPLRKLLLQLCKRPGAIDIGCVLRQNSADLHSQTSVFHRQHHQANGIQHLDLRFCNEEALRQLTRESNTLFCHDSFFGACILLLASCLARSNFSSPKAARLGSPCRAASPSLAACSTARGNTAADVPKPAST